MRVMEMQFKVTNYIGDVKVEEGDLKKIKIINDEINKIITEINRRNKDYNDEKVNIA